MIRLDTITMNQILDVSGVKGKGPKIKKLTENAKHCTACNLYKKATQTVFGEGKPNASVLLVGEQPGNDEDIKGHPFVGPAGKILAKALDEAGISRQDTYITNAVKHFKFEERGKRRLHKKPNGEEIRACRPWLLQEISVIHPKLVICLGVTAAQSVLGRSVTIKSVRRTLLDLEADEEIKVGVTVHPSAILRVPDHEGREKAFKEFVEDLRYLLHRS